MAKGSMRPSKEVRKPKKDKKAGAAAAAPTAVPGSKFATAQPELVTKKKKDR